jgi:hypothetical protein
VQLISINVSGPAWAGDFQFIDVNKVRDVG